MFKADAEEAAPIVNAAIDALLSWLPTSGRPGFDARQACGDMRANCLSYLRTDTLGPPLSNCFELARLTGMNLQQMDAVRAAAAAQGARLVGAIVVRDACIELALAEMSRIIINMVFASREDVDTVQLMINAAFAPVQEEVADQMDALTFRSLVGLHAAITAYLVDTARPLPRMLTWRFGRTWPTLVLSHKLYADAGNADLLRQENKIVHPAFAPTSGRGLSG
jgi:prophage DNA circulation protein